MILNIKDGNPKLYKQKQKNMAGSKKKDGFDADEKTVILDITDIIHNLKDEEKLDDLKLR
jgi:hypothetical protein